MGKRLHATVVERTHPQRVVFHHVPKCGGTSVGRALRQRYILSQATVSPESSFQTYRAFSGSTDRERLLVDVLDFREQMLLYLLFEDVRCVSAHVRFSTTAYDFFHDRYRFITILRDPVDRLLSHYRWNTRMTDDHGHVDMPFDEFLESERALRYGAIYAEYFSGLPKEADIRSDEAIESAIANLARFDVVGRLDDLAGFRSALKDCLGAAPRIGHENAHRGRRADADHSPEIEARIRDICAPDIAIWSHLFQA